MSVNFDHKKYLANDQEMVKPRVKRGEKCIPLNVSFIYFHLNIPQISQTYYIIYEIKITLPVNINNYRLFLNITVAFGK